MDQPFAIPGYRLLSLLGFGGTGEVWRGVHEETGHPVALKRLWEPAGPELVGRLKQDALQLDDVAGQHVVAVHEIGRLPNREVVLVLEYAAAGSLATLLAGRSQLRAPEVVTILGPLAKALAAAHAVGLRHGDLTPSNVVFTADGRPKLSDFGLAIATGERSSDDHPYRDPALANGASPGAASDVFGLAAIGYAALTGVPPRPADLGKVPAITDLAPDVPAALASAVEAAMSPDPDRRPDTAAFASAILRSSGADPVRFADSRRTTPAVAPRDARPPSRRRGLTAVIVVSVGLAALTGAGWVKLGQRPAAAVPPSSVATPPGHADDYRAIVAHLLALRDRAFSTGRLALLLSVYPKNSDGWQLDAAALQVLRSQHLRTRGFVERLDSVVVEDQSSDSADLQVTTSIAAYTIVKAAGRVVARRAGRTQAFELVLQHVGDQWLVQALSPTSG